MKQVFTTTSLAEAESMRALLRGHHIEAALENEGAVFYAVGLPTPAVPFVLSVSNEAEARARAILAGHDVDDPEDREEEALSDDVPVLTPEEEDRFRRRVEEGTRRSRLRWVLVFVLSFGSPSILALIGVLYWDGTMVWITLLSLLAYLGTGFLLHFAARRRASLRAAGPR